MPGEKNYRDSADDYEATRVQFQGKKVEESKFFDPEPIDGLKPKAKKNDEKVLFRVDSRNSNAHSQGGTSATSDSIGSAMLGMDGSAMLGLKRLNRPEWDAEEQAKRAQVLPLLKTNLAQIDGTIKPAFSHFSKKEAVDKRKNLEAFGLSFYEELFSIAPELQDTLFKDKPTELLSIKLGTIMGELIRLLELPSPVALANNIAEMSLKHVEYGLEPEHAQPFRDAMVAAIKKTVKSKGHKWHGRNQKAWNWALKEIISVLVEATVGARPKVTMLNKSWLFLCEKMYDEAVAKNMKSNARSSIDEGRPSLDMSAAPLLPAKSNASVKPEKAKGLLNRFKRGAKASTKAQGDASQDIAVGTEYPMWTKKQAEEESEEYVLGRETAGDAFVKVFAEQNAWAVKQFDYGLDPEHGKKMGLAMELIVSGATKPQKLNQRLRVLALGHVQMGIKPEMFPHFEKTLFSFLQQMFGKYNMFDRETEEAWKWVWKIVEGAFSRHLNAAEVNMGMLTSSWDYISENHDIEHLSDKFFESLFQRAPGLQRLFVKPKKTMVVMFAKAMELIVKSVSDTAVLEVDLKAIAMRHIKYDIGQEHLTTFGEVLIQTLGDVVGVENWDEDTAAAWADMYGHVAQVFNHVISTGRNLVSKALATGSPEEVAKALDNSPRNKRVLAALEIDVDDSAVSPIVWSLAEGQIAVAGALIKDILAIRGDRDNYYYGRQLLWAKLPFIVPMLVGKAVQILPIFLDGHLWVSRFMEHGSHRRVNYYIKELYGDPYVPGNANPYATTIGVFITKLPESELANFGHPCISAVINLKWDLFGRRDFFLGQLLNIVSLLLSSMYLQIGPDYAMISLILALMQLAAAALRLVMYLLLVIKQYGAGNATKYKLLFMSIKVPFILQDFFTLLNLVSSCFVVALFGLTYTANPFGWKELLDPSYNPYDAAVHRRLLASTDEDWAATHDLHELEVWADIAAFTTCLLWLQMAELFKASRGTSSLIFAISAIMNEVARFCIVLGCWAVGFSAILYFIKVGARLEEGHEIHDALNIDLHFRDSGNLGALVYYVIMSSLGLTGIDVIMESGWLVRLVYAICILSTVIVTLNLLVSTMVSLYEHLQKGFNELANRSRAELVVRAEQALSLSHRQKLFDGLGFEDRLDFEVMDDGPAGGIQRLVPAKELKHPSYNLLDRVERYAGSSNPTEMWEAHECISKGTDINEMFGMGSMNRNNACNEAMKMAMSNLERVSEELFALKQGTMGRLNDDGASQAASSAQSGMTADQQEDAQEGKEDDHEEDHEDDFPEVPKPPEPEPEQEAAPEPELRDVSMDELTKHSAEESLWMVIGGVVHDATAMLQWHPGGKQLLLDNCGPNDAEEAFNEAHTGPSLTIAKATLKALPKIGKFDASAAAAAAAVPVPPPPGTKPTSPPAPRRHSSPKQDVSSGPLDNSFTMPTPPPPSTKPNSPPAPRRHSPQQDITSSTSDEPEF